MAGALCAAIEGPRLDRNLEALVAELRRRGRAEQAVRIGPDSVRLAAVAAVLAALLDTAFARAVVFIGVVLAGVGFHACGAGAAGRRLGIGLARIVFLRQLEVELGLWLILFELSGNVAVPILLPIGRAMNFVLILIAARIGQPQVEALLRGRLLPGQFVL